MYLAQVNIARVKEPLDSPVMQDFVNNLEPINRLAEGSDGFIWRLKEDDNNATGIRIFDDEHLIVNMSVWRDIDSLRNYVFRTAHAEFLKRRKEWFLRMAEQHMALWYVPVGHEPSIQEAEEKLLLRRRIADSPAAFGFQTMYSPSGTLLSRPG